MIYFDENNEITEDLVRYHNLFERIWNEKDEPLFYVKINIINNLLLTNGGYEKINQYLCEIIITLSHDKRFVSQSLVFIINYFEFRKWDIDSGSRFDLLVNLLYSLPGEVFSK